MHILILSSGSTAVDPHREAAVQDLARALHRSGCRVGVALLDAAPLTRIHPLLLFKRHFQIVEDDAERFPIMRVAGWETLPQTHLGGQATSHVLQKLVRAYVDAHGQPDVIDAHDALWAGHAAMTIAQSMDVAFVVTEHGCSVPPRRLSAPLREIASKVYAAASAVVTTSETTRAQLEEIRGIAFAEVVPPPIDTEYFTPRANDDDRPFTIVAVGDRVNDEDAALLLRTFAMFRGCHGGRLIITGATKDERQLSALAKSHGCEDVVEFTGVLPRWHMKEFLREASVVMPSSNDRACTNTLLEALVCGVPVIAIEGSGADEIVSRDLGVIVPARDAEMLAVAMAEVRRSPYDPARVRQAAMDRLSNTASTERLRSIYHRAATNAFNERTESVVE